MNDHDVETAMTTDEMRSVLDRIYWSQGQLADYLGVAKESVHKMARGSRPIPPALATWLNQMAAARAQVSDYPDGWRHGVVPSVQ